MKFHSSSDIWSKILFACVIQAGGFPHREWMAALQNWNPFTSSSLSTLQLYGQGWMSSCCSPTLPPQFEPCCKRLWIYKVRVSSLSQTWRGADFSCRRSRHFTFGSSCINTHITETSVINPAERIQIPHCCWLYDLKSQPESGWGAVGSPVLFQPSH